MHLRLIGRYWSSIIIASIVYFQLQSWNIIVVYKNSTLWFFELGYAQTRKWYQVLYDILVLKQYSWKKSNLSCMFDVDLFEMSIIFDHEWCNPYVVLKYRRVHVKQAYHFMSLEYLFEGEFSQTEIHSLFQYTCGRNTIDLMKERQKVISFD